MANVEDPRTIQLALRDQVPARRLESLQELCGSITSGAALPLLLAQEVVRLLDDPNEKVREAANAILGLGSFLRDPEVIDLIRFVLSHGKSAEARTHAARTLAKWGLVAEALPTLITALACAEDDPELTAAVYSTLSQLGSAAAPALPHLFPDGLDWYLASVAVTTAWEIAGGAAFPLFYDLLRHRSSVLQEAVLKAIDNWRHSSSDTVNAIVQCASSTDDISIQCCAIDTLLNLDRSCNSLIVEHCRQQTRFGKQMVAGKAAAALCCLGHNPAPVSEVRGALNSLRPAIRWEAVLTLSRFASSSLSDLIPDLVLRLHDCPVDYPIADRAGIALGKIGPAALEHLLAVIQGWVLRAHYSAVQGIREMGRAASPAIPHLLAILDRREVYEHTPMPPNHRGPYTVHATPNMAFAALSRCVSPEHRSLVPLFLEHLEADTPFVREAALVGLQNMGVSFPDLPTKPE